MSARRRFGQHFLEPVWVARLVELFEPSATDQVLEIGPGRGAVTLPVASRVARLVAVEIDHALASSLAPRLPGTAELIVADVLATDLGALATGALEPPVRVVGNLPYNIAAPILFRLLGAADEGRVIADALLMVQREVATRLAARPGSTEYGVLSVLVQRLADVALVLRLPPGAFRPAPKVESAVVRLSFRPPAVRPLDPAFFEALVRGIFAYRRKTVANALRCWAPDRQPRIASSLASAGIDPRRRPETLHLSELATLADVFASGRGGPVL